MFPFHVPSKVGLSDVEETHFRCGNQESIVEEFGLDGDVTAEREKRFILHRWKRRKSDLI